MEADDVKIIFAERKKRSEAWSFIFMYRIYRGLYRVLTGDSMSIGNFSVVPGRLIRRLAHIEDIWNHFPAGVTRARLPIATIPSERGTRLFGKSKMNLASLIVHAFSGFSVFADIAAARIVIATFVGVAVIVAVLAVLVWQKLFTDAAILGWTSDMVANLIVIMVQILTTAVLSGSITFHNFDQAYATASRSGSRFPQVHS